MRPFETAQLVVIAVAVLLPVLLGFRLKRARVAALLIASMIVQLVAEGYRWQLLPMELTTIGLAIGDVAWDERTVSGLRRFRRGALGPVGVAALAVLPTLLPIPEMPVPAGPFAVGTQDFVIVEEERLEEYGLPETEEGEEPAEPTEQRRFVVQAWYPASAVDGLERLPWNPDWDIVGDAMAGRLGFPGFFLSHADVLGWSYPAPEPISGRLPVVIYSHGWTGFRTIAINQVEALASRGFVVLAADHTYGSIAEVFPNGTVVELDPRALGDEEEIGEEAFLEQGEQLVETFADDIVSILNELDKGRAGAFSRLRPDIDLDRIGVYGHSTGGGAAVRACIDDERCKAVAGLDAWVNPIPDRVVARELQQPSMFLRSDGWRGTPNDGRLRGLAERSPDESHWLGVTGAAHNDFVITPLFSPIGAELGLTGSIPADRIVPILDTYLRAFFERYLLGSGGAALDEVPPAEVTYEFLP